MERKWKEKRRKKKIFHPSTYSDICISTLAERSASAMYLCMHLITNGYCGPGRTRVFLGICKVRLMARSIESNLWI
jgi:hypothetical protein